MGSLAAGSFLGAGVSLRSVRGFGARAPRGGGASTSAAPAAVWFAAKGFEAKEGEARREERSPRRVAVELWDKAQRARDAAKRMSVFAAVSYELQSNEQVSALWHQAEDLEEKALAMWAGAEDDWMGGRDGGYFEDDERVGLRIN